MGLDDATAAENLPVLKSADLDADPHGILRKYRGAYGLVRHEAGGYLVLRQADIERLGNDPRVAATGTIRIEMLGIRAGAIFDMIYYGMLNANGADHRRRRSALSKSFAARMIADLRPSILRASTDLIDSWYSDGQAEFIEQFAALLPARVIGDFLGLRRSDIPLFTKLVYDVTRLFRLTVRPDEIPEIEAASRRLRDYVEKTLDDRRRVPGNEFLSEFIARAEAAGELSPLEIIFQIVGIIIGATDTTRVAITMQVALLLRHRDQWEAVCRDRSLIPGAVAEALRFEPAVGSFTRISTEDIAVGAAVIPSGQLVTFSTMSGMRDEGAYARPDEFDIHRTDQPRLHPIFGAGPHRCIGEALARVELEESLAAITARIPRLQLDQAPTIRGHGGVRRVDAMRVSWQP
jgi:cytochrome P450 family 103